MTDLTALFDGAIIPAKLLTPAERLYAERTTSYRWEVLRHDPATGADVLAGVLCGVTNGQLAWASNTAVKGSGTATVSDLAAALPGLTRIADVDLVTARLRPVLVIEGLPEIPLSVYLITASPETWTDTGRTLNLELHDKAVVLDQDGVDQTFTAPADVPILTLVAQLIASAGETITVDASVTATLAAPKVWEAGTSKLVIINDLLDTLGWNSLWVDGAGNFRVTPYIKPAARPITYDILSGVPRELVDGQRAIYQPDWQRDRDSYGVPNRVVATGAGGADAPPLSASATNENPDSPYSYPRRGRWITTVVSGIDVPDGTDNEKTAALAARANATLVAMSAVQAAVQLKHLPLPLRTSDVLRFRNVPAGIDARHVVVSTTLECKATGLATTTLQEVTDL